MLKKLFVVLLVVGAATSAFGGETEPERGDAVLSGSLTGWKWELAPPNQPYPDYLADPRRPRMNFGMALYKSNIPDTSAGRFMLDAGTRFTLFKVHTDRESKNEVAIDIEGGLFNQFDMGNSLDSVGWDGRYGVFAVHDWSDTIAWRVGYRHLSAHLGDEYIETTGKERVGYTRDMLAFGASVRPDDHWTFYLEPTWAWSLGNKHQERWSLECGGQYVGPFSMMNGNAAFFAAAHVRMFQESGWEPGVSGTVGYLVTRGQKAANMRLMLEGYVGRAILGEFAMDYYDAYVALQAQLDFY